ncbi:MAG TPA: LacI family DNA-binding transcriptional regulator [Opitutaceae bacterium]|nr:LacI family DNA-binding transcriptional regulator [Opitutaceae bacterium]
MNHINQERIAEQLKISRATVSRSLANHPSVSAETRAAVHQLAAELGYSVTPGRGPRRRRGSKPFTIGVIIGVPASNVAMATFPEVLKGIRQRADADDIAVDVCYENPATFDATSPRLSVFRQIRAANWRGAILIYPFPDEAVKILADKISLVTILEDYSHLALDSIDVDNAAGTECLVQLLADRGHRRIGFVAWHYTVGGHWAYRRFGGYTEALFRAGLEFSPEWVINIHRNAPVYDQSIDIAREVARLTREQKVTAWVCAADHQAYHLINDLRSLGLKVPADCSVTGFDGIEPPVGQPPVTTVRVPTAEIGESAVARLAGRLVTPRAPYRKILVEADLIAGATVAAPPAQT